MRQERMVAARPVISTIAAIIAIGAILASVAPPHWQSCEMILLVACIALVWECFRAGDQSKEVLPASPSLGSRAAAWLEDLTGDPHNTHAGDFRPWDVEQAVSRLRSAAVREASDPHFDAFSRQPVEQITQEMLTQAFRHTSLKHHPADVSDAENTRRVYAARQMILRASHQVK